MSGDIIKKELSIHPNLKVRKLKNGITTYLIPSSLPANCCELRLIVKVGSMNESDEERGYAHFIEHLGFKGTKSFQSYELVKALESLGITYGPDMNASTDLFETKYRLTNLSIDSSDSNLNNDNNNNNNSNDNLSQIKLGMKILYEWAFEMTISESDVEEEKQVIFAEYRAKQGLGQRLLKKYWPLVFSIHSKISNRMPIGIPEIFMQLKASHLKEFYKKWYRPENMCIICCGDIQGKIDQIDEIIINQFDHHIPISTFLSSSSSSSSSISMNQMIYINSPISVIDNDFRENKSRRLNQNISIDDHYPYHTKDVMIALSDSQITIPQISMEFCWPYQPSNTVTYYKQKLMYKVLASILNNRFAKIVKGYDVMNPFIDKINQSCTTPFVGAGVSVRDLIRGLFCYGITFQLSSQSTNLITILSTIFFEFKRLELYGVSELEVKKAVNKWQIRYHEIAMNSDRENSATLASEVEEYFLWNESTSILSAKEESSIGLEILQKISVADMNNFISFLNIHKENKTEDCGPISQSFRVLSCQFRNIMSDTNGSINDIGSNSNDSNNSNEGEVTNEILESLVAVARTNIAALAEGQTKSIFEWPMESSIESEEVISAAKQTLNVATSNLSFLSDLSNNSNVSRKNENENEVTAYQPLSSSCNCCASTLCCGICIDVNTTNTTSDMILTTSSIHMEEIDTHYVTLTNGIQVCLKYMPKDAANKVSMQGFALQGISELSSIEGCIFTMLDELATASGYSDISFHRFDFSGASIQDLQTQTNTSVSTQRHHHHRGIGGSCPTQHLELLLALLCLRLSTAQIFQSSELEKQKQAFAHSLQQEITSPYSVFLDRARILTCGDIPICRPYDPAMVESITIEQVESLYYDAFVRDPTEFTFVFVGDLPDLHTTVSLLNRYIGSLKVNANLSSSFSISRFQKSMELPFTPIPVIYPTNKIKETLHYDIENDKASCIMVFMVSMPIDNDSVDIMTSIQLDTACKVLQSRLLDTLRMKLGKVYYVSVERSRNSLSSNSLISIGFHGGANDMDQLQQLIEEEIIELQTNGPKNDTLLSVKESMLKSHKMSSVVPSYWLFWILDSWKSYQVIEFLNRSQKSQSSDGYHIEDRKEKKEKKERKLTEFLQTAVNQRVQGRISILDHINVAAIQDIFKKYFMVDKAVTIDLRPNNVK